MQRQVHLSRCCADLPAGLGTAKSPSLRVTVAKRMEEKQHLFSYGTLRDQSVQRIIFGNTVPMRPAVLNDWSLHKGADGYLFIKPEVDEKVSGMMLTISQEQLRRADQWEEVPLYLREKVLVADDDGMQEEVWVYTRRDGEGEPFFDQTEISGLALKDVLKSASALEKRQTAL